MSRIRSRARLAAVAAISGLALALFPGGAFAAAHAAASHDARPGASVATSVRWHVLALRNGWVASQPQLGAGVPRVAIQDGVVYLSGSMYQLSPAHRHMFATLPRGLRPGHNLWLPVFTLTGAVGSLEIAASGRMSVTGPWATAYTSLAGISFPARSVRLHALSLLDGWASSQAEFGSGDPAARIQDGVVYLAGSMHQASGTGNQFAVLPKSLRPARNSWLPIYTYNGVPGDILISVDGRMWAFGQVATAYTSLAGISFPARSVTLRTLRPVHGWVAAPSFLGGKPLAGIRNGIVYLAGGVQQPSGTNDQFATLPRAFRPAHNMWLPVFTGGGAIGSIEIASSGRIYAFGGDATGFTGLTGISFPVNY